MLSLYLSLETGIIITSYILFCNCPRYTGGSFMKVAPMQSTRESSRFEGKLQQVGLEVHTFPPIKYLSRPSSMYNAAE